MNIRFSMRAILAATALIAVDIVSILHPHPLLSAALVVAAGLRVLVGIVAAIVRRGPARAYWVGLAVFGVAYFALCTVWDRVIPSPSTGTYRFGLPTTNLVVWMRWQFLGESVSGSPTYMTPTQSLTMFGGGWVSSAGITIWPGSFSLFQDPLTNAIQAGHSLFVAVFAWLGGWVGNTFSKRNESA
jgi:hypothetical protein